MARQTTKAPKYSIDNGAVMRRILGPKLEANIWANMEQMLGPMLVVLAATYTMRQIAQHWKQTLQFAFQHWKHPLKRDKKTDSWLLTFQRQRWKLAVRHSRLSYMMCRCFQCSTLEVFDASCSRGLTQNR